MDFFDDRKDSERGDANALITLLGEELNASTYKHFRKDKVEILNRAPSFGTKKGNRLDRWIVDRENNRLLQCEIKNWAASAIDGKRLKSDASDEDTRRVVEYNWKNQLNVQLSNNIKHPGKVSKVLLKMKLPKEHETLKTEPLLIYWMPISLDRNGKEPLSKISVKMLGLPIESTFTNLYIFSVSLYLRQLYKNGKGEKDINLDMAHLERRIKILNKLKIK